MKNRLLPKTKLFSLLFVLMICTMGHTQYLKTGLVKKDLSPHGKLKTSWYNLYWFYELNAGSRLLGSTSNQASLKPGINTNASLGYLFNEKFGVKGRADYHSFQFLTDLKDPIAKGSALSLSLAATTNLLALFSPQKSNNFRLNLQGGAGWTTYSNRAFKSYREENNLPMDDPFISGNDDMGHIILGLSPQYHLNSRVSLNLDFTTFLLFEQDFTLDNYNGIAHQGLGNISTLSVGITLRP